MASLLDIGPLTETVTINGIELTVQGLTAAHLFTLFAAYPAMRNVMERGEGSTAALMQLAPDLIAKIIAIATGSPGDAAVEEKAKTMGAADQVAILSAVQRLSFRQGFGPFVQQITELMGTAEALNNPSARHSSASATPSQPQFNAALQTDTPGMMRGTQRRAN